MEKNIDFGQVADIYDSYTDVDFDIGFFKTLCKGHKKILELMCGTGRVSMPLAGEGYKLTCVDYSEEMLDVFRRKLGVQPSASAERMQNDLPDTSEGDPQDRPPIDIQGESQDRPPIDIQGESQDRPPIESQSEPQNVNLVCQDVCELELEERFDLIIIPSNSFAEILEPEKRMQALRKIYRHLTSDGIFFLTLYNPEYRRKQADGHLRHLGKYDLGDGKILIVTYYNTFLPDKNIISGIQFYEIYENNRLTEKRYLDINFALISKEEICKMAYDAGFCLIASYGDYAPYHFDDASTFMNLLFKKKRKGRRHW